MSVTASSASAQSVHERAARPWGQYVAFAITAAVLLVALLGPYLAPHDPNALLGIPFSTPSHGMPLGTDELGRDVLSRVLAGGRSVVLLALVSTLVGYVVGASIGLASGYSRSFVDPMLMRVMDVLLAFPPILLLMVLATGAGHSMLALAIGVAIIHVPGVARIVRAATLEVGVSGFVEAAVARGESTAHILFREILPNIRSTIAADAGPRFTVSILLVAAINYLGLGERPPASNWALMINENRDGLSLNPWAVVAPAILIALLTVSINVLADRAARQRGR